MTDSESKSGDNGNWRTAQDSRDGRTYYYNRVTRETTWNKPYELASPAEREIMLKQKSEVLKFFKEMEENIKMKMNNNTDRNIIYRNESYGKSFDSIEENLDLDEISGIDRVRSKVVRTMSSLDDEILKTLNKSGDRALTYKPIIRTFSREDDFKRDDKYSFNGAESPPSFDGFYIAESKDEYDRSYSDRSRGGTDFELRRSPRSPGVPGSSRVAYSIDLSARRRKDTSPTRRSSRRRNSTGTIFIESTMSQQDNNATIRAVCAVIRQHMIEAARSNVEPGPQYSVFSDPPELSNFDSPMSRTRRNAQTKMENGSTVIPSLKKVEDFFMDIFSKSQLEGECIIMALIYCERLVRKTRGRFCIRYDNWRSTLFACLVMASKVWDDLSMWNVDFSNILPTFNLQKINDLELKLLEELGFVIRVSAGEYAKYYFHLRSLMGKLGLQSYESRTSVPLDLKGAQKLQLSTEKYQALTMKKIPHSKSVHDCQELFASKNRSRSIDTHEFISHHSVTLEELVHQGHMDGDGGQHVSRAQSFNNSREANAAREQALEDAKSGK